MSRYGATLLRIVLGVIFALNGYLALFALDPGGAADAMTIMGFPLGRLGGWYVIAAHVLGGLMMIVGLKTRWAALANIPVIVVALVQLYRHGHHGFFMTGAVLDAASGRAGAVGLEYPLLVLGATGALALLGGGALAMTDD